jgi:hypothetical protein
MGWLDQHVARISKGEQLAAPKLVHKIRGDMVIGARHHPKRDSLFIDTAPQVEHSFSDVRSRVLVEAGENVRGAGNDRYPIIHES